MARKLRTGSPTTHLSREEREKLIKRLAKKEVDKASMSGQKMLLKLPDNTGTWKLFTFTVGEISDAISQVKNHLLRLPESVLTGMSRTRSVQQISA